MLRTLALPVLLGLLWLVELLGASRVPLVTLLVSLPHLPLAALPLGALALEWRARQPRRALVHLLVLLAVLAWSGFELPSPAGTRGNLRLLTFNIHGLAQGAEAVRSVLEEADADVVVLQECHRWNLQEDLYPGGRAGWHVASSGELAILSRTPLRNVRDLELSDPAVMSRPALAARVGEVTVVNLHFSLLYHPGWGVAELPAQLRATTSLRNLQARHLDEELARLPGPVVLAGDLNAAPGDPAVRAVGRGRVDAFASAGLGFGYTFAADLPVVRIDYVLPPAGSPVSEARVVPVVASDHRGLVAEFALPAP